MHLINSMSEMKVARRGKSYSPTGGLAFSPVTAGGLIVASAAGLVLGAFTGDLSELIEMAVALVEVSGPLAPLVVASVLFWRLEGVVGEEPDEMEGEGGEVVAGCCANVNVSVWGRVPVLVTIASL